MTTPPGPGHAARPADGAARDATLLSLYRTMLRIRAFENAAETASQGGVQAWGQQASAKPARVRGPLHLSTGQEAVAAGVCANLRRSDLLTSTHRGHGHTLAKGADVNRMMAELFGRATGCNQGKGGSMHIADFSVGMLGANGVVADGLPIAVGAAHALRLRGVDAIVAAFFGDGAINRGPFLEALNWAAVYHLPVLFVCEDNGISATTKSGPMTGGEGAAARSDAIGVPATRIDGNDVEDVHRASAELIEQVRAGTGPRMLHAVTYRHKGHLSIDTAPYRDPEEVRLALERDPIKKARRQLYEAGLGLQAEALERDAYAEIETALAAADRAPLPDPVQAYEDIMDTGWGTWK